MPTGAFNVTRLIAELGLKPVVGEDVLRVLGQIQPTMQVGDLSDVTPPHVAPSALFGSVAVGGVGDHGTIAIQCLAPGGAFVEWLTLDNATTNVKMTVRTVDPGATTVIPNAGQVSRDAIASIARQDGVATVAGNVVSLKTTTNFLGFSPRSIFVPRAAFFILQASLVNTLFTWGLSWREVPASEHVPS